MRELATKMGVPFEKVKARIESLREANPMLGFRGCRLGMAYPEITEMQARAIFTAAKKCRAEGIVVHPEVMIPLVNTPEELRRQAEIVRNEAAELGVGDFLVGTMIEVPRAALVADQIAQIAEFFSFGTNDLTQTTFGLSRDDTAPVLAAYLAKDIYPVDPFVSIDRDGVGELMKIGVERGRAARPGLKVGICGEHGGDPSSVEFCHQIGLDYVSCSPYRLPIARLAAAQAALREGTATKRTVKPVKVAKVPVKAVKAVKAVKPVAKEGRTTRVVKNGRPAPVAVKARKGGGRRAHGGSRFM
jgi:pyruvate,orthophosphate dikinase